MDKLNQVIAMASLLIGPDQVKSIGRTDNKHNWIDNIYAQIKQLEALTNRDKYTEKRLERLRKQFSELMAERDAEAKENLAKATLEASKKV